MTVERFESRSAVVADVRRRLHASFLCSGDQFDVERIVDDCFRVSGGAWVQVVSDSAFWLAATSYAYPDVVAGRLIIESLGFPVSLVRWSVVQGHGPRPVVLDSGVVVGVHRAVDSLVFATVRRLGWHPGVALELGRVRSFSVSYAHGSVASKRFYRQGRHVSTRERKAEWLRTVKGLGEFESVDARLEFYDDLILAPASAPAPWLRRSCSAVARAPTRPCSGSMRCLLAVVRVVARSVGAPWESSVEGFARRECSRCRVVRGVSSRSRSCSISAPVAVPTVTA
jgi:hypothetical protein